MRIQRPANAQGGFTLVELLVAMGIFGILMAIVGAAMLTGFSAIRGVLDRGQAQGEAQNTAEWASKLLHYADIPAEQTTAITEAGPSSITFFTYAGTGAKNEVPYKARLYVRSDANGEKTVVSQLWTPTPAGIGWTWNGTPASRDLLTVPKGAAAPLSVKVFVCDPTAICLSPDDCAATQTSCTGSTWRDATPVTSGAISLGALEVPRAVAITVGNRANPEFTVTQTVRLVNLS